MNNNNELKIFKNEYNNIDKYYNFTNKLYNRNPNLIIKIENVIQLKKALKYAKLINKRISIRSGGHSSCSYSILDDTVNLDLSGLNEIKVNTEENTVVAQSGCTMLQYYSETTKYGLASPGGTCPSVGLGGIGLAGGTNYLSPMYGYLVDNIIEFTVLLENGEIVKANQNNQFNDLYWALAGSGHGGFGIVIDYKIKLYPIEPYYYENYITFELDDLNKILEIVNGYIESPLNKYLLNHLGLGIDIRFNLNNNLYCTLIYFYNGPIENGEMEFNKFYNLLNNGINKIQVKNFNRDVIKKSFLDIIKSVPMDNGTFRQFSKCRFLSTINEKNSNTFNEIINLGLSINKTNLNNNSDVFEISASIYYQGGKQSEPNETNSFIHRGNDYKWIVVFICKYNQIENDHIFLEFKNQINKRLPIFHNKIYQNYPDDDIKDWQNAYYGRNYSKLQKIKLKYDPNNYFRYPQSIELPSLNDNYNSNSKL